MDPLKTAALPRVDIADFIKSDRGVRSYEDLQGDTANIYAAIATGSFLTVTDSPSLGSERVLTLTGDLDGIDGGPNAPYTLGLSDTAVVPGNYGGIPKLLTITVDAKGRLTSAIETAFDTDDIPEGAANLYYTDARARAALSGGTGISYDSGTGVIALDTANTRNVDHVAVTLTAGAGLTGGGDITASRTLDVGAGTGISVTANDVGLDTANTRNVDHTSVTFTAGAGLTGGGDISANRTFDIGAGTGITVNANDVALTVQTASGVYTPTLTNVANLTSSTAYECQYLRVGDVVHVGGRVDMVMTTAGADTQMRMSLPIPSDFAAGRQLGGSAYTSGIASQGAGILADPTNDTALFQFVATASAAGGGFFFTFTYSVI